MGDVDDHAIVIGAGVTGVLTARALARRFARVTVVDRDTLRPEPAFRPGLPQSPQIHAFWKRGVDCAEYLLPGLTRDLADRGAHLLVVPRDFLWLSPVGWFPRVSGTGDLTCSRPLLDWLLRHRADADPRIEFLQDSLVTGLVATPGGDGVQGVRVRTTGSDDSRVLTAGLVADASGRRSEATKWLTELGYAAPSVERYDAGFGYSSRYYKLPDSAERDWKAIYIQTSPSMPRGAALVPVEGGRWMATLMGCGDHVPPTKDDQFLDYVRSLRSPVLYEALREAEPLSDAQAFRNTANEWRHYESMDRRPRGFIVLGDALCRFNPVYGQGMTVGAMSAKAIADAIDGMDPTRIHDDSPRLQRVAAAQSADAWALATGEDLRFPWTRGRPPGAKVKLLHQYMSHVVAAGNVDASTCRTIFQVFGMTAPPTALFKPSSVARVLSHWRTPTTPSPQAAAPPPRV
ncbi:NAD(P)/FAD-dependent oxidoreductase [Actinomadura harenae]|uniref:FAD-dependent oxidoreductase n=1 Tax=Actinomadura harenae TaxID=2483351 RepID=A0A3M2LHW9_9ACTN|nr:FAD-dependent monooxygenase [Actinomadura harenae]RMI37067.1 FAD-dependent oxidoreductase [Actinomadura harenae]